MSLSKRPRELLSPFYHVGTAISEPEGRFSPDIESVVNVSCRRNILAVLRSSSDTLYTHQECMRLTVAQESQQTLRSVSLFFSYSSELHFPAKSNRVDYFFKIFIGHLDIFFCEVVCFRFYWVVFLLLICQSSLSCFDLSPLLVTLCSRQKSLSLYDKNLTNMIKLRMLG